MLKFADNAEFYWNFLFVKEISHFLYEKNNATICWSC